MWPPIVGRDAPFASLGTQVDVCVLQNSAVVHWLSIAQPVTVPEIEETRRPVTLPPLLITWNWSVLLPSWKGPPAGMVKGATEAHAFGPLFVATWMPFR